MANDPFEGVATPVQVGNDPFSGVAEPTQNQGGWVKDPSVPFKVRRIVTPDTQRPTFQREDGAIYYGPEQGNQGKPGWFNAQGKPAGDVPQSMRKPTIAEHVMFSTPVQAVTDIPMSALQLASQVPGVPKTARDWVQKLANEREQAYQRNPENRNIVGDINRGIIQTAVGGRLMPQMVAPGQSMVAQGAAASMLQPVAGTAEEVPQEKLQQGTFGAGAGIVGRGISKAIPRLANAIKGTVNAEYAPMIEAAEQAGIKDYTVGDISRNRVAKILEKEAEHVPNILGGTGKVRERGLEQIDTAIRNKVADLADKMNVKAYGGYSGLTQAAESGDANASRIVKILDEAASDPHRVLRADLEAQMAKAKLKTAGAYDKVGEAVQGLGDVDVSKTVGWIDDQIGKYSKSLNPDKADTLTKILNRYKERLIDPELGGYRGYNDVREAVSALGDEAKELAAKQDYAASKVVGDLRRELRSNMDSWVSKTAAPEAKDLLNEANKTYQKELLPYKKDTIVKMLEGEHPDKAVKAIYSTASPDEFKSIWNAAGPKGKSAIQYALVQEAMDNALNQSTGKISPAQFASYMEKRAEQVGVAFKGEPQWYMDGFVKLLRHMERAGQLAAGQDTGKSAIKWALAGAAAKATPEGALSALALANTSKFLLTSPAGKRLLLAASDATPGSKAMQKIAEDIAIKSAGAGSSMMNGSKTQQQATQEGGE